MAEPGVWRCQRMELLFILALDWFFVPYGTEAQLKAEGIETLPMSLPRPVPGSARLRELLDQ
jgi:hypothetical protein